MKNRLLSLALILLLLAIGSTAYAEYVWDHPIPYSAKTNAAVAAKVDELASECAESGAKGDFEIALWLHDWLTDNADYDESYTEYGPDGVLLKGTGVCQSYTLAYGLLLDEMGIENQPVYSMAMNHMWNLVKLEGNWYHIDCTWDDPTGGGAENHDYFGLSDALMSRDHSWDDADSLPACSSNDCNYYLRTGECTVVSNQSEMYEAIRQQLTADYAEITLYNDATDGFSLIDSFEQWMENESWRYTFSGYSYSGSDYRITICIYGYNPDYMAVEYTTNAVLEKELTRALASGAEVIYIYDHSGNVFNDEALYDKAAKIVKSKSEEYGCSLDYSYGYGSDFIVVYLAYITVDNLPDPFPLANVASSTKLTLTTASGSTVSSGTPGKRAIWVFGRSACYNTQSLLSDLSGGIAVLKKAGITVNVGLEDYPNGSYVEDLRSSYGYYTFGSSGSSYWTALRNLGYDTSEGLTFPAVFIEDTDGKLIYFSTGYVYEPTRLIATAVKDQIEVSYENVLVLPAALTAIENGAFKGSNAFEEVKFGGNKVVSIGAEAFRNCTKLKRITIPDSVKSISSSAFDGCPNLVIYSSTDSYAKTFAQQNGIAWKAVD